jgi:hypothetical protein
MRNACLDIALCELAEHGIQKRVQRLLHRATDHSVLLCHGGAKSARFGAASPTYLCERFRTSSPTVDAPGLILDFDASRCPVSCHATPVFFRACGACGGSGRSIGRSVNGLLSVNLGKLAATSQTTLTQKSALLIGKSPSCNRLHRRPLGRSRPCPRHCQTREQP